MDEASIRRNRRRLVLIAALFVAPFVMAVVFNVTGWRPFGTVNHGTLITPPRAVDTGGLRIPGGEPAAAGTLRGRWSLVYLSEGECGEPCERALAGLERVQTALGRDASRVERLYVTTGPLGEGQARALVERHPGLRPLEASPEWVRQLAMVDRSPALDRVYLVDPEARLMMVYEPGVEPAALLDDLERLFKVPRAG